MNAQETDLINFIKAFASEDIKPETLLFKEHILDSMNILALIGYLERKLQRKLKEEEILMSHFESVRAITKAFFKE